MSKKNGLKYVIVRAQGAGVFAGELVSRKGTEVTLKNSRRLWYWSGAASLSEAAVRGFSRPDQCRFPVVVPEQDVTGVLEVLTCTDVAEGTLALWKSGSDGRPCNGGTGEPVKRGDVQRVNGPLALCGNRALHATLRPNDWKGERVWLVVLRGAILRDGNKLGALEREILGEVVTS